jgi:hypothetical protein
MKADIRTWHVVCIFKTLRLVNDNDTNKNLQISHLRHINIHM